MNCALLKPMRWILRMLIIALAAHVLVACASSDVRDRPRRIVREGVELWRYWKGQDLFDPDMAKSVCDCCRGLPRSLHTNNVKGFDEHKEQIDGAQRCGVDVIVLHPSDLCDFAEGKDSGDKYRPDLRLTSDIVNYASDQNVTIALENGGLDFLVECIENVEDLRICLDIGHVYLEPDRTEPVGKYPWRKEGRSMSDYLDALGSRLVHLHIQDILPESEIPLPDAGLDHYTPGTGAIPESDWKLLFNTLDSLSFDGLAMLEIRPRKPFLQAQRALRFLQDMQNTGKTIL